jgi:hypothetical protein
MKLITLAIRFVCVYVIKIIPDINCYYHQLLESTSDIKPPMCRRVDKDKLTNTSLPINRLIAQNAHLIIRRNELSSSKSSVLKFNLELIYTDV